MTEAQYRLMIATAQAVENGVYGIQVTNGHPQPQFVDWQRIPVPYKSWGSTEALCRSCGFEVFPIIKMCRR